MATRSPRARSIYLSTHQPGPRFPAIAITMNHGRMTSRRAVAKSYRGVLIPRPWMSISAGAFHPAAAIRASKIGGSSMPYFST